MDPEIQELAHWTKATLAAGTLKVFRTFTAVVNFFAWLLCLPLELILHRRIGKRYMCTPFVALALLLAGTITAFTAINPAMLRIIGTKVRAAIPTTAFATGTLPLSKSPVPIIMVSPPGWAMRCVVPAATIAFALHYRANRKRFGTPDQGHSFDSGIPWLIFPFGFQKAAAAWLKQWVLLPASTTPVSSTRELMAYPSSATRGFAAHFRHHLNLIATNRVPHGPFTWWVTSVLEPAVLFGLGVLMCLPTGYDPFGAYLIIVGLAMAFKAAMREAEMRERIYDEVDGRLEIEVMRNIRADKPLSELSVAFTVPLSRAVMTNRDNRTIVIPDLSGAGGNRTTDAA
jgi:hypothetical protein